MTYIAPYTKAQCVLYLAAQNVNRVRRRSAAFFSGLRPPKLHRQAASPHIVDQQLLRIEKGMMPVNEDA